MISDTAITKNKLKKIKNWTLAGATFLFGAGGLSWFAVLPEELKTEISRAIKKQIFQKEYKKIEEREGRGSGEIGLTCSVKLA